MKRRPGVVLTVIMLIALQLALYGGAVAQAQGEIVAVLTAPLEGQQLFGLVNISGSAGHPTAFDHYTLEYNALGDPNSPWMLVQEAVRQQVQDNVLGAWNTNFVPDGVYALRLRVFLTDGQVGEAIVSNFRVINSQPTPVPTAASGIINETPIPTLGPTPTSPIQQPPSNNPQVENPAAPVFAGGGSGTGAKPTTSSGSRPGTETRINMGRVRSAFCTGAYLTFGIFFVILVYSVLRGRLRPFARRLVYQMRDDYDGDY